MRVSDAQTFQLFTDRANRLQSTIQKLQDQVASGRRLLDPEDDPLGAARATRFDASLAALAQYDESSRFGADVLGAQDHAIAEATALLVRAEEIATQQASDLLSPASHAAAREEVHGLLQALTVVANSEFAGRRLFGGLALGAAAPFADPDGPGYDPATAYGGSTQDFFVKVGSDSGERVRISTRGDTVFQSSLQALEDLETALAAGTDSSATLAALSAARDGLANERASVGGRESELLGRATQLAGVELQELSARSRIVDVDTTEVITALVQAQTALQALFSAQSQIAQTTLVDLLLV